MGTIDFNNPLHVACGWANLQEPGDETAGLLRSLVGADTALEMVMTHEHANVVVSYLKDQPEAAAHNFEKAWQRWRARLDTTHIENDLATMERLGGWVIYPGHELWPEAVEDLGLAAPVAIWGLGSLLPEGQLPPVRVAIVGARACTAAGERHAWELGHELAHDGVSVVSGGAFGIDIAAHHGALKAGHTLAVMAGGLSQLYPRAHEESFQQVVESGGGIISEVPPFWRPARWRFVSRNRVIAAISDATIMVEAASRSGAVVTLARAMEMGREVGAYPGPVGSPTTEGCHQAIRNGATLVTCASHVLEMVRPLGQVEDADATAPLFDLAPDEQRVFDAMPKRRAARAQDIAVAAGLGVDETLGILARLVLGGKVSAAQQRYARRT
ncbi:MAG: DNA-processing protein DprA [Actinomycetaceae bacterium]|nr:DNA-processing protein DprA [Actinomycetaceae bacterium]